jgi:hypothetical protein
LILYVTNTSQNVPVFYLRIDAFQGIPATTKAEIAITVALAQRRKIKGKSIHPGQESPLTLCSPEEQNSRALPYWLICISSTEPSLQKAISGATPCAHFASPAFS